MEVASLTIMDLKLANKLDARNDLLNLTIGDLKLANKLVVAMEEDGEALEAIEAMEEASSTILALKLGNKLDARRDLPRVFVTWDLKLASKSIKAPDSILAQCHQWVEALEEDGETIEAMEEASLTIMDLKLANNLVEGRNVKLNPK